MAPRGVRDKMNILNIGRFDLCGVATLGKKKENVKITSGGSLKYKYTTCISVESLESFYFQKMKSENNNCAREKKRK